jgi:hypothetical protein
MNHREILFTRRITKEYIEFMKKTGGLVEEAKRATVLALKKVLKLKDGDSILIKEDGSLEIETGRNKQEGTVPEDRSKNTDKITLNGREVTPEELERQREFVEKQKGARLVETSKGKFQLRLNG